MVSQIARDAGVQFVQFEIGSALLKIKNFRRHRIIRRTHLDRDRETLVRSNSVSKPVDVMHPKTGFQQRRFRPGHNTAGIRFDPDNIQRFRRGNA